MIKTKTHIRAEHNLPIELREVFNLLVEEYKDAGKQYSSPAWVNYSVLADLIRGGWRKVA